MTDHDEILLQRCVDGEISAEQRAELLQRLEARPDGWKVLACSYMEDQLIGGAVAHAASHGHAVEAPPELLRPREKPHWFHHPLMSVALSVCVAFLGGLLISREMSSDGASLYRNGLTTAAQQGTGSADARASAVLVAEQPDYRLRLEAGGETSRDLPVYEDASRFMQEFKRYRQRMRESLPDGARSIDNRASRIQFIQLQMEDGRTIVVPYEETPMAPPLQ